MLNLFTAYFSNIRFGGLEEIKECRKFKIYCNTIIPFTKLIFSLTKIPCPIGLPPTWSCKFCLLSHLPHTWVSSYRESRRRHCTPILRIWTTLHAISSVVVWRGALWHSNVNNLSPPMWTQRRRLCSIATGRRLYRRIVHTAIYGKQCNVFIWNRYIGDVILKLKRPKYKFPKFCLHFA